MKSREHRTDDTLRRVQMLKVLLQGNEKPQPDPPPSSTPKSPWTLTKNDRTFLHVMRVRCEHPDCPICRRTKTDAT
jgi:hypothetical protein